MMNRIATVQECDATNVDQGNLAGNIIIITSKERHQKKSKLDLSSPLGDRGVNAKIHQLLLHLHSKHYQLIYLASRRQKQNTH